MLSDKPYITFESIEDRLTYLRTYGFLAKTKSEESIYYCMHPETREYVTCSILGYEAIYDSYSTVVVDYGDGPYFICSLYLLEMQSNGKKNAKLESQSCHDSFQKRTKPENRFKGSLISENLDTYIVFDFETTSLCIYEAELLEISAIKVINNEIVETFSELIKPINTIPSKITKVTGITELDVFLCRDEKSVLADFIKFIGDIPLVGYNIHTYDTNILYDLSKLYFNHTVKNNYIDVYSLARNYLDKERDGLENYKLTTICDFFDVDSKNAHRALDDCYMCNSCYQNFCSLYMSTDAEQPANDDLDLENINIYKTDFEHSVINIINTLIATEELPENSIYLLNNSSKNEIESQSICIYEPPYPPVKNAKIKKNFIVLNIVEKHSSIILKINKYRYNHVSIPTSASLKEPKKLNSYAFITFEKDDSCIYDFIKEHILTALKFYKASTSFGCCSNFVACSDALKCVHQNKIYSKGCAYRKHLDNGQIFYGKNKNV